MSDILEYRALDYKVLAVAVAGGIGDWTAYIGAVEGKDHDLESNVVARKGSKLPQRVAELLFPGQKKLHWRN